MKSFLDKVIDNINTIPRGKVASYGQIAAMSGSPRGAIIVGTILHRYSDKLNLPWQRVINSKGFISTTCLEHPQELQAELLKAEGVKVEIVKNGYKIDDKYFIRVE